MKTCTTKREKGDQRVAEVNVFLSFLYERGLRLKGAARRTRIPIGTLAGISAGTRPLTPEMRARIAKGLKCKPEEIPDPYKEGAA